MADLHVLPASSDHSAEMKEKTSDMLLTAADKPLRGAAVLGVSDDGAIYLDTLGLTNEEVVYLLEVMKAQVLKAALGH